MLKRIVKMEFKEDRLSDFLIAVKGKKKTIRSFKGCEHLEFWQDHKDPCIIFTFSCWKTLEDLNAYRYSSFFKETWQFTKSCFRKKAEAWSFSEILTNAQE